MACTALKITKEDGTVNRIKMMTVPYPGYVDVDVFNCNEEFIPIGEPMMSQVEMDESEYHKKLRSEASEKGHYVPEESTDPHWNPGYVEPPYEESPPNEDQG